jgi:hypothetical protein
MPTSLPLAKRLLLGGMALVLATLIWLPSVHLFFAADLPPPCAEGSVHSLADGLAARHLHLWTDPDLRQRELDRMRASNAEWDFMGRGFLVWSLANMALRYPERNAEYLAVMDLIIAETLQLERDKGLYHFLMPYARARSFVQRPARSLFVDGEIALMLALRRLVEEKDEYRPLLRQRIDVMHEQMAAGPVLCAESYPDECWMFCNAVALAAMRVGDHLDGTDHGPFFARWLATAKTHLIHPETGLLVASFTLDGRPKDGPEGSSIWMVAHCLKVIDADFAADQYARAKKELGRELCGFGYAREWPVSWEGPADIDSGPVIPVLNISAGSSGLAFLGARTFDDREYFRSLQTTLDFAAFPMRKDGQLRYSASNQVGDAALLYAAVFGPAWEAVEKGRCR